MQIILRQSSVEMNWSAYSTAQGGVWSVCYAVVPDMTVLLKSLYRACHNFSACQACAFVVMIVH